MKKILLILLLVVPLFAQSVKDIYNSSTTALDTSAVFTGTAKDVSPYNSVSVSLWSDNAITLSVEFGDLVAGSFVARKYFIYSYSANDSTFTKSMPVVAPYFRVVATNGAVDSADVFNLVTQLHKGTNLPTTANGRVDVDVSSSALPTGAATSAKQDEQIDTTSYGNDLLKLIRDYVATGASSVSSDTLAQNDTVTVNYNNAYEYVYITITDTASASGDSIYVQVSNSDGTAWSTVAITDMTDLSTDAFITIATNLTKRFRLSETYPFAVRIYKNSEEGINTYYIEAK